MNDRQLIDHNLLNNQVISPKFDSNNILKKLNIDQAEDIKYLRNTEKKTYNEKELNKLKNVVFETGIKKQIEKISNINSTFEKNNKINKSMNNLNENYNNKKLTQEENKNKKINQNDISSLNEFDKKILNKFPIKKNNTSEINSIINNNLIKDKKIEILSLYKKQSMDINNKIKNNSKKKSKINFKKNISEILKYDDELQINYLQTKNEKFEKINKDLKNSDLEKFIKDYKFENLKNSTNLYKTASFQDSISEDLKNINLNDNSPINLEIRKKLKKIKKLEEMNKSIILQSENIPIINLFENENSQFKDLNQRIANPPTSFLQIGDTIRFDKNVFETSIQKSKNYNLETQRRGRRRSRFPDVQWDCAETQIAKLVRYLCEEEVSGSYQKYCKPIFEQINTMIESFLYHDNNLEICQNLHMCPVSVDL